MGERCLYTPVTAGDNILLGSAALLSLESSSTLREEINPGTMPGEKFPRPKFEVRTSPLRPPRLISWRCPTRNICARIHTPSRRCSLRHSRFAGNRRRFCISIVPARRASETSPPLPPPPAAILLLEKSSRFPLTVSGLSPSNSRISSSRDKNVGRYNRYDSVR